MKQKKSFFYVMLLMLFCINSFAQPNFTANSTVPAYTGNFTFGTNGGWTDGWSDEDKATIAVGDPSRGIEGIGANSMRLKLHEEFLEKWGYDIREDAFNFYGQQLGMHDMTVFVGAEVSVAHTDYDKGGKIFKNLYEPIWDDGANGTPVNENNYLAVYLYKLVQQYGDDVRFWEIWNEPDFTDSQFGGRKEDDERDSWWHRDPKPEELKNLKAPIEYYIRTLRVSYEVIKSLKPNSYVCIGGIGYSSFLDAVLRNTDNFEDGGVSNSDFPLKGGAYFDCVSYHSYPMYKMKTEKRNSDRAVEVTLEQKTEFARVLTKYGYNGTTYPEKKYIITEANIPHKKYDPYIGSQEAQRNFLVKSIISCQKNDILSFHTFELSDEKKEWEMRGSYDAMGFYKNLDGKAALTNMEMYPSGIACRKAMQFLKGKRYAKNQTQKLQLPANVDGAAFIGQDNTYSYVLWAKATGDNTEAASASYTFAANTATGTLNMYNWNYNTNTDFTTISGKTVQLTGAPCFITDNAVDTNPVDPNDNDITAVEIDNSDDFIVYPIPAKNEITIEGINADIMSAKLYHVDGKYSILRQANDNNKWILNPSLPTGIYFLKVETDKQIYTKKIIIE